MFKKILIANRGEIAVRIARTCRETNIPTVALYETPDQGSLHVRSADESVRLDAPGGFMNGPAILHIAQAKGADAIHPGYGFLAEQAAFVRACEQAGITFIGPPSAVVAMTAEKIDALQRVRAAGILTPDFSSRSFEAGDESVWRAEANALGFPLLVKPCLGGRGRGAHLVHGAQELDNIVRRAQQEAQAIYGDPRVYFERAILPARQLSVQILADTQGHIIHLGEREGTRLVGNQKVIEEAPSFTLTMPERKQLWQLALQVANLFEYQNAGTVEFLRDSQGNIYFSEIKARIQVEHALTEMLTRLDLVREQIRLADGAPLDRQQAAIRMEGWAMQARLSAQDSTNRMLPSPGRLQEVRLPGGPEVRTDTYVYPGCQVPPSYDPLIAKLVVWGQDRRICRNRLARALGECRITGTGTTLPLLRQLVHELDFAPREDASDPGTADSDLSQVSPRTLRDLAIAVAFYQQSKANTSHSITPERMQGGWHRSSRVLPE